MTHNQEVAQSVIELFAAAIAAGPQETEQNDVPSAEMNRMAAVMGVEGETHV